LVRLAGIEPTTPWFVAKYSIQLSYSRADTHCSTVFCASFALTGLEDTPTNRGKHGWPAGHEDRVSLSVWLGLFLPIGNMTPFTSQHLVGLKSNISRP